MYYDVVTYLYVREVCFRYLSGNLLIELIEMDYQSHDNESLESGSVTLLWFGREHVLTSLKKVTLLTCGLVEKMF